MRGLLVQCTYHVTLTDRTQLFFRTCVRGLNKKTKKQTQPILKIRSTQSYRYSRAWAQSLFFAAIYESGGRKL